MKREAKNIVSLIPKVDYADVRIIEKESQNIATKDGVVEALESSTSLGYGIRVLKDGAWGFAGSNDFTKRGIERTIKRAVEIAESSARHKLEDVELARQTPIKATYRTPIKEDPFKVPLEEKLELLLAADNAQRVDPRIVISQTSFSAHREHKTFASTNGSLIEQEIVWTGAGLEASATGEGDFQNRSYPNSHGGQFATRGYELVWELDLVGNAPRVGEEAVKLLDAPLCPTGEYDIILDSNQLALQIHESCGHAAELDRVLGYEASYAGTSFLTPEKLGKFRYGSRIVNLTADATIPGGLGTFGYDDEGVPAQRTFLVKNGIFMDYLTSRETAVYLDKILRKSRKGPSRVGEPRRRSNGTMRATGWEYIPLIRMTNVNLEPPSASSGPSAWKLEDLIADTKRGVFMSTNKSWSIDDRRLNFQFGTEIGWEIKNGKLGKILKNPTYQGMTPKFWRSCDAICGKDEWIVWGTPNCGKGQPSQVMYTGHGASPARFRKVKVGVVKW
ncbi:TldD/PmbA family protein [Candidatus Microgenomates bacterium]|nr:TldD/PmbA family protein [Candidatus Microgenomates bacterium]